MSLMRRFVLGILLALGPGTSYAAHPPTTCTTAVSDFAPVVATPGHNFPPNRWQPPASAAVVAAGLHAASVRWDDNATGLVRLQIKHPPNGWRSDIAFCRVRAGIAIYCIGQTGPPQRLIDHFDFSYRTGDTDGPETVEMSVGTEAAALCHSFTACAGAYFAEGTFHADF